MKVQFYELFPIHPQHDHIFIVEMPEKHCNRALATKVILADGWDMNEYDYCDHCIHDDIYSATARARGCEFLLTSNNRLTYKEKQGSGNTFQLKYTNYNDYTKINNLELIDGEKIRKVSHIDLQTSVNILKRIGYQIVEKVCPPGFDGCTCRECKTAHYMAEPDGIKEDGMLTCYQCRERLKSYRQWPYR